VADRDRDQAPHRAIIPPQAGRNRSLAMPGIGIGSSKRAVEETTGL